MFASDGGESSTWLHSISITTSAQCVCVCWAAGPATGTNLASAKLDTVAVGKETSGQGTDGSKTGVHSPRGMSPQDSVQSPVSHVPVAGGSSLDSSDRNLMERSMPGTISDTDWLALLRGPGRR